MQKARQAIVYGNYFWEFYYRQTDKVKKRIDWTIGVVEDLEYIPERYFKYLGQDGIYEIRVSSGNNIFRVFCFFDEDKLIILLNCFQKKTQKTPHNEIEKAKRLKQQYYEDKETKAGDLSRPSR